jgi:hypothetical protein
MQTPANVKVPNKQVDQGKIIDLLSSIDEAQGGKKTSWAVKPLSGPDGDCPVFLSDAIWDFQNFWLKKGVFKFIDGVVDPGMHTIEQMNDLAAGAFILVSPEGQLDASACWAASLAWMTRAVKGTPTKDQMSILAAGKVGSSGKISLNELLRVNLGGVNMNRQRIPPDQLQAEMDKGKFPMFIAFQSGPMSGHVNVIHGFDDIKHVVSAMEPWFPDPSKDNNFELVNNGGLDVYENKKTHLPFKFQGAHVKRPFTYYSANPLEGAFVVGRINSP